MRIVNLAGSTRRQRAHARHLFHDARNAAHILHLLELLLEIFQVKTFAFFNLTGETLSLLLVNFLLGFFNQREHIPHTKNAGGNTVRIERLKPVNFFPGTDKFDWLASDMPN